MKKKASKTKSSPKSEFPAGVISGVVLASIIFVVLTFLKGCVSQSILGPKFSKGDCLMNRAYELVRVDYVYTTIREDYYLIPQKANRAPDTSEKQYFLSDSGGVLNSYYQNHRFVDAYYTKVNCEQ